MTGVFLIDWSILALSLFNTILQLWLGLTVLLNADRRTWGVWIAGGGLLAGAAFFLSHTAILGLGPRDASRGMNFWWHAGWVPVIVLPFTWYVVMLWYAGFWQEKQARIYQRERLWFLLNMGTFGLLLVLLFFANQIPSFSPSLRMNLSTTTSLRGIPVLALVYPAYILLCIGRSLVVLRYPGPTARLMGQTARQRARPWLVAASLTLLLTSLLVGGSVLWIVLDVQNELFLPEVLITVGWIDLLSAALISLSVILIGQAVTSYEVFTGKILPRKGLARHWRRAIILALAFSLLVAWSLAAQLHAIYSLLLATLLLTIFYAILNWHSFTEREHFIKHLRPFVSSQRLYEYLLTARANQQPTIAAAQRIAPTEVDVTMPFHALCTDVLGVRQAFLIPLGPLAPLFGSPLAYPAGSANAIPSLAELIGQFASPRTKGIPLNGKNFSNLSWAIPLWGERGLIGVLLLAQKQDQGLFTEEEIEIAQAIGERLIDAQAGAEMARRLMSLQRQRLVQNHLIDRRSRQVLHDDVLPLLHATMLSLAKSDGSQQMVDEVLESLSGVHRRISSLLSDMPSAGPSRLGDLGLLSALRNMLAGEFKDAFDQLSLQVQPGVEQQVQYMPLFMAEVTYYAAREALRNAAAHGRSRDSFRPLHLWVTILWQNGLLIQIKDNGIGFKKEGHQPDEIGPGNGHGLVLHSTMMAVVGGSLAIDSIPGECTEVRLTLPEEAMLANVNLN